MASADDSYFSIDRLHEVSDNLRLGLVRSQFDATIEVYQYHCDEISRLFGSTDVHAGVDQDVKVGISLRPVNDIIAILKSGGDTLATKVIDIDQF